ncbi:glycerol-3-phosphate O-acyltransferase [Spirochaetia bacterium]|nr:glycerol-3-phosphate O-acyltransferase [Spirochaetia bacterium]GHU29925.1 glycerol-3-phosphate O-acyltransferase [Spirochaetia bacterium]
MEGQTLKERYGHLTDALLRLSRPGWEKIDESNVYQEGNPALRKMLTDVMIKEIMLPNSHLEGREHFAAFSKSVQSGKTGLILMEHYSNLDTPEIYYLLEKDPDPLIRDIESRMIAIAGMKLNEEDPMIRAWAESFTRIVIYPSRSLASIADPVVAAQEDARSRAINGAAIRALHNARKQGKVILVFPSGTRYRPGHPETKRGVREIESYLRIFDVMILVAVHGSGLRIDMDRPNDMLSDRVVQDTVVLTASPVLDCKTFRKEVLATVQPDEDPKQVVADRIMASLETLHEKGTV